MDTSNTKEIWMEMVWPGYHWYQGINPFYAYLEDIPKLGYKFSKTATTYSKGTEAFYFIESEYQKNGAEFFKAVKKNPKLLFSVLDKTNRAAEEIFKLGKKWTNVDFSKLTNVELIKYHSRLFFWDKPLWRFGQIPNLLEFHNSFLTEYVKTIIVNTFGANTISELFNIFTVSNYTSVTESQERNFLRLLEKSGDKPSEKQIRTHWKKYTWMIYGWAGPALGYDYFSDNFKLASKDVHIAEKIKESIASKKLILRKQKSLLRKLKPKDRQFVLLLRAILEQKARRVDAHSLTYFLAEQMMSEIGKRVGLTLDQMRVVAPDYVAGLFKSVDISRINDEYNRVMFWYEDSKLNKLSGVSAENKLKYILERLPKVAMVEEFKGGLAYPGKITGQVRIILDIKNSAAFKPGEILVTRITDPSYVPIMKIAGAIVTDVGGITCHAAIVARELKIPCIVGTKIATKVLKDGDMVEMDAERGVVKIIKRAA